MYHLIVSSLINESPRLSLSAGPAAGPAHGAPCSIVTRPEAARRPSTDAGDTNKHSASHLASTSHLAGREAVRRMPSAGETVVMIEQTC
eukprot:scaffold101025_cov46-Phaeocystis_antarctica.AAC.2